MLKEFVELVNESVDEGFERGIALFMENLEVDFAKEQLLNEHGFEAVMTQLFENANVKVESEGDEKSMSKLDKEIEMLEAELKNLDTK